MELRHLIPNDLLTCPELVSTLVYCLREVSGVPCARMLEGKVIQLAQKEILLLPERAELELGMNWEALETRLRTLEELNLLRVQPEGRALRIEARNISWPITPAQGPRDTDSGIIPARLSQWPEIDRQFRNQMPKGCSKKYHEMCDTAYAGLISCVGEPNLDLRSLTKMDVLDWQKRQRTTPSKLGKLRQPSTINDYLRALKAGFQRAVDNQYLAINPAREVDPIPETRKTPVTLNQDEFYAILPKEENWFKYGLEITVMLALRRNETLGIQLEDIELDDRKVRLVRRGELGPKMGDERTVSLPPDAVRTIEALLAYREQLGIETDRLLTDERGTPISPDRFTKTFKKHAREADLVETKTLHALRRTTATKYWNKGESIPTVMALLGHKNAKTTYRYLGIDEDNVERAVAGLSLSEFTGVPA